MEIVQEVVIVGAGIAGLATAVALKRVGVQALVLERSEVLRATGAALTLSPNAWRALDALGVADKLLSVYDPIQKGYIADIGSGQVQEVFYIRPDGKGLKFGSRPVHRRTLLETLAQELPVDSIRFSSKLIAIDQIQQLGGEHIVILHLEDGSTIKSKVLIGCDGVHSVVADWLGLAPPVHSGRSGARGLAVYPQGHGLVHGIQQFVDVGRRGGFVPLDKKDVYWFLTCLSPQDGKNLAREPDLIKKQVLEDFASNFPRSYQEVVHHSDHSSLTWAPLMLRYPWDIMFGKLSNGNVTVAGDAMHPMTPELGQGGCCALEDAVILGRHIGNSIFKNGILVSADVAGVLAEYTKERKWRAASLVFKSYVFGWVQQAGNNWWIRLLRDKVFYGYLGVLFWSVASFDCGKLPSVVSCGECGPQSCKRD